MEETVYWYALSAVLLFFKMLLVSVYQGYHRIGKMTFRTPEDAAYMGRQPASEELPQVQRAARAWQNDLENIPAFLALGVAYVWVGASPAAAAWLFPTFIAARYLHTLFYLAGLQPWRTLAYTVGIVCMGVMSYQILASLP